MSGVMNPGRKDVGLLSTVMKGLAIARDVYGIKTDMAQLDNMNAQEAQRLEQQAEIKKEKQRLARGVKTQGEYTDMLAKGDLVPAKQGEAGTFDVLVQNPDDDSSPITQTVRRYEKPVITPKERQPTRLITTTENGKTVQKIVPDVAGGSYEAPPKAGVAARPAGGEKSIKELPYDQQITVKKLGTDNATRTSVVSQMRAELKKYQAATDEDTKVKIGQGMLKLLNSPGNPDAIGSEEAERVGGFLEYKKANFTQPGSFIGRDLDLFEDQVLAKIESVEDGVKTNQSIIDDILGRKAGPKAGDIVEVDGAKYKVADNGDDLIPIETMGSN